MNIDLSPALRRFIRLIGQSAIAAVFTLVIGTVAHAATLKNTFYDLRLLGHVQNAAGTEFSTEGYEASPEFDAFDTNVPNTIVPTPDPPFDPGNTLRVNESEAADTAIIWIRGPAASPNHTFANELDPSEFVELDFTFRFDEVDVGNKVAITGVDFENGTNPLHAISTWSTSGLGTAANPMLLAIRIDPAEIQGEYSTSHVKVHVDFMEMAVPEPATIALMGIGAIGAWGLIRRRCYS